MKRGIVVMLVSAFLCLSLSAGNILVSLAYEHSTYNHPVLPVPQVPVVDGSQNPASVPDIVAYETLFRLLTTGDDGEDKNWTIRDSYLKWAGFDEVQIAAVKFAAADFKQRIRGLDEQAAKIKDENWPVPQAGIIGKLGQLQAQKESLIMEIRANLHNQLFNYNPGALDTHVNGRIKSGIKGYTPGLPSGSGPKKVGFLKQLFRRAFVTEAAAPQYGSCSGQVFVSSSTWADYGGMMVYSSAVVTSSYNSCGHGYTLSTNLYHSSASASGSNFVSIPLDPGGNLAFLDGNFSSGTTAYSYCSHTGTNHPMGGSGSSTSIAPFVELVSFVASNDNVDYNAVPSVIAQVKSSQSVTSGMVKIVLDEQANPGLVPYSPQLPITSEESFSGSIATFSTVINASINSQARKGPVTIRAGINSAPPNAVIQGGTKDVTICFGPKVNGICMVSP